jgi:hypothetical protein
MEPGEIAYRDLSHLASTQEDPIDLDEIRAELYEMSDKELIERGKSLAFLCSPKQNFGKPPREVWAVQLKEARAEWRRRHPSHTSE